MTLHKAFIEKSKAVRPSILKLARRYKLIDQCFKEFQREVFPGAGQDQVAAMRTCFFAGVAELHAVQMYAADTSTMEPTEDDLELYSNIMEEVELFHKRTIDAARADTSSRAN